MMLKLPGEQMSCSLISAELIDKGFNSRSWISWQVLSLLRENTNIQELIKLLNLKLDIEKNSYHYRISRNK